MSNSTGKIVKNGASISSIVFLVFVALFCASCLFGPEEKSLQPIISGKYSFLSSDSISGFVRFEDGEYAGYCSVEIPTLDSPVVVDSSFLDDFERVSFFGSYVLKKDTLFFDAGSTMNPDSTLTFRCMSISDDTVQINRINTYSGHFGFCFGDSSILWRVP
jgi:hypothetical protein